MYKPLLTLVAAMATLSVAAASRDAQWKQVEDAINKGLPRTAIEALNPIIEEALAEHAYPEATKAVARRIVLEANIQGNKPEEKIRRMEPQIERAPPEMKPLLETIQANWYWQYFQANRWRFLRRTPTEEQPEGDFTTWSLSRLMQEIDRHFENALAAKERLQKIPIDEWDALLEKGTMPDAYRPTLYDFIAHEALDFYRSGEFGITKPEDSFHLPADTGIFAPPNTFLDWNPQTTDTNALTLRTIRLYQDLMRFHLNDDDRRAFLDANLDRLEFGGATAVGEAKAALYKASLKRFADTWPDQEISAMALYDLANELKSDGDWVAARAWAERGHQKFPDSPGGKQCHNLILQIGAPSLSLVTERVWNEPWPSIQVQHRNLRAVHFRLVKQDWEQRLEELGNPGNLNQEQRDALLKAAPALQWTNQLPATTNYQLRTDEFEVPEHLEHGFYYLIASSSADFAAENNQVTFTAIWVSDLALVVRSWTNRLDGFVLAARTGEPIAGAEVQAWSWNNRQGQKGLPTVRTDGNGHFVIDGQPTQSYVILARANHDSLASSGRVSIYSHSQNRRRTEVVFFTDRAIYRPGQFVRYKAILVALDPEHDQYQPISGRDVTVIFADPNGKEIARQRQRSNAYGSLSGTFTAPHDRLTGQMRIYLSEGPEGGAQVRVEEYKRPKFHVDLEPPVQAPKLGSSVTVPGKATAYTRAAVDGASVQYRVVREVQLPYWLGWQPWGRSIHSETREIAHGVVKTTSDGSFKVTFDAAPDPDIPEKAQPFFIFRVDANVTDSAGETRSSLRSIAVGYTALQARMDADDWQVASKPVEVKIHTTSPDGEGRRAEGKVTIYALKQPDEVRRPDLFNRPRPLPSDATEAAEPDLSDPRQWPLGTVVQENGFTTDPEGKTSLSFTMAAGEYRAVLETQDRFGKAVTAYLQIRVLDPGAAKLPLKIPHLLASPDWSVEPGQEFMALWGTGYQQGRAFIEIEHRQRIIRSFWTDVGRTQQAIRQSVTEDMRGGFTLHVTQVRENRSYLDSQHVDVPWSNKHLEIKWEHFVSRLKPDAQQTWTAVVTGPNAQKAVAEMVATLYDASLDVFRRLSWPSRFHFFRQDNSIVRGSFANTATYFQHLQGQWKLPYEQVSITYRTFPPDLVPQAFPRRTGYSLRFDGMNTRGIGISGGTAPLYDMNMLAAAPPAGGVEGLASLPKTPEPATPGVPGSPEIDLSKVSARKNLNETAFFFPQLLSDSNGLVRLQFTMPEALTEWRFLGFAHDKQLRSGYLEDTAVTAKELMVQPNPPRFLREGDRLEFTVKVSNQSAARQPGKVQLNFRQAMDDQSVDEALGNESPVRDFDIPAKESQSFSWQIDVPKNMGVLIYKAVGSTGRLSDGEEGYLPVLSRRLLLTESLTLPIRGPATNHFQFKPLLQAADSPSLQSKNLVVQMVSNPAWYAVLALPYLMEYPHECSEQVFNRLYANALARHIAQSDPKIRRVFDLWKNTPALQSPLEKNEDVKNVVLEETPWLQEAQSETQARHNIGLLFDDNHLDRETRQTLQQLSDMQFPDGAWPWFPGGPANDFMTLYITTGFGRLRHLGLDLDVQPVLRALDRSDAWFEKIYRRIVEQAHKEDNHLTPLIAFYLYSRSFFLKDKPIAAEHREAVDYFLGQARRYWVQLGVRQSQGHLALALQRWGDHKTAVAIMKSIKERAITDPEWGMFWRDLELSWWWYRAPIETQALMIEAFDEVTGDAEAVEECQVWLLKQKQTQDWKTTKATADAVYALLMRGPHLLSSQDLVRLTLDDKVIEPEKTEAGTGFYEERFTDNAVKPELGQITVRKTDPGVAWGSISWQYLEDIDKVKPRAGTPLELQKSIYKKTLTKDGPVLQKVDEPLEVGDELVVRIVLRTDRDMEYVHLKDQRGSGTEPLNVLSRYRYQDGLAYYESTRDVASHFFIDYLPKGTYVFEYSTRVFHRGRYQSGIAEIQSMYAPEFNSHSGSVQLVVK